MVPAIFKEQDAAEDSDAFDSCEEIPETKEQKRTGNPFNDFNLDIQEIKDPDDQLTIKISRKLVVDWIESGDENDMTEWKQTHSGGHKKNSILGYMTTKPCPNVRTRIHVQFPNQSLDSILKYVVNKELRLQIDCDTIADMEVVKDFGMDTKQVYIQMKSIWPLGDRDSLVNTHLVKYDDRAWIINTSVENDDLPISS